ncbi:MULTISPECIES: glycosyltransferase family 4 protein [Methanobacterium]|uniref:GDP-Man:Man(1)GlcNAc(2)-PP-Dol alpha-1,3-mannosyltransferase n=1 Tax=Methanobacterium veterum TaxID=408577 RepID=A0A9E5DPG6_9EURY|nr:MULTISPECIES: glycosyltransferase family 4 protein [Methanobacterium]MCZ3367215.1 glycosyltransferase family 4 protein [Methanobacterium veterum]MCZ3373637.1 glycosyltransferase family 4 protein [Methanobacterium veterum]
MKKTLKIAVFHNLPSGGAKRALYDHVKYLVSSGHEVDVFVPETANENFLSLIELVNNFKVFPVKTGFLRSFIYSKLNPETPSSDLVSLKELELTEKNIAADINGGNYDVVLSEQDKFTMSPFILKYIKIPAVYYCQQPLRNDKILEEVSNDIENPNFIRKKMKYRDLNNTFKIDSINAKYAKYILANSYFSRESLLKTYGLNSFVSYLGIDTYKFKPLQLPSEDFVLSVGSCTPIKGYDFTIRSLSLINEQIRPEFTIVSNFSSPEWKNYIEKLANKLGVKLTILDLINDHELIKLYNKAKMVIYTPYLEPFGLIPIESMSCGTPVVAVKEGGVRETVVHNETGLLIDRDENLFAQAILELLRDTDKSREMSKNAITNVQNFWTLEHAGIRLLNHLNLAIDRYTS